MALQRVHRPIKLVIMHMRVEKNNRKKCLTLLPSEYLIRTQKYICDWLWENPPLTHKDKLLEIRNSILFKV